MNKYYDKVVTFIDNHRDEMIDKWKFMVNMEDYFADVEDTAKVRNWFQIELEELGFKCTTYDDLAPGYTGPIVGILGEDRPGKPIIFAGHLDTVQPKGSFGDMPFKIKDGKAYGPGVLDMKGGLIIALYVVKALNELGYKDHPIKFVVAAEEESSHTEEENKVTQFFIDQSKGGLCAFDMETGHISNSLCTGRKSKYEWFVKVHGIPGHSGNEFEKGRNAIHEAAIKINEISKLTDLSKGTTVNTSMIKAGTPEMICAIPEECEFIFETRFTSSEEQARVAEEIKKILATNYIEGTTTEYHQNKPQFMAFHPTEPIMKFLDFLNGVAKDNGFPEFGSIQLGGSSDSGAIAASGIPVLCSCGVRGQFNHSMNEYAVVESMFERAKIYALAVLEAPDEFA